MLSFAVLRRKCAKARFLVLPTFVYWSVVGVAALMQAVEPRWEAPNRFVWSFGFFVGIAGVLIAVRDAIAGSSKWAASAELRKPMIFEAYFIFALFCLATEVVLVQSGASHFSVSKYAHAKLDVLSFGVWPEIFGISVIAVVGIPLTANFLAIYAWRRGKHAFRLVWRDWRWMARCLLISMIIAAAYVALEWMRLAALAVATSASQRTGLGDVVSLSPYSVPQTVTSALLFPVKVWLLAAPLLKVYESGLRPVDNTTLANE
jgi:hypothetical protein